MATTHSPTSDTCPDLEDLAAFTAGRLQGEERLRVLQHLDHCERCVELVAETLRFEEEEEAATTREQGSGIPQAEVVRHPRWRQKLLPLAAAAAFLAFLVRTPLTQWASRNETPPLTVAELLKDGEGLAGGAWLDEPISGPRSAEAISTSRLTDEARAFRIGVALIDLKVAHSAGDAGEALIAARSLRSLADPLGAPFTPAYQEAIRHLESGDLQAAPLTLEELLPEVLPETFLALGKWAEAGRRAAAARDLAFFERRIVRRFPRRLDDSALPPAVRDAIGKVSTQLASEAFAQELPAVEEAFAELLREGYKL